MAKCLSLVLLLAALAGIAACGAAWSADRTAEAKRIVASFAKGDFATPAKSYADVMKKAGADKKVPEGWKAAVARAGPFQKQLGTRTDTVKTGGQTYDRVFVTCQFQKSKLDVLLTFDSAGKLAGVFFTPSK
jgi:hypothetical protein